MLAAARSPRHRIRVLDGADIAQAGLRQVHALGDVARLLAIHVEREHHPRLALLGPTDDPAERTLLAAEQPRLGADDSVADLRNRDDISHQILAALGDRQHAAPQPIKEIDLLHGIDTKVSGQPELVYTAAHI